MPERLREPDAEWARRDRDNSFPEVLCIGESMVLFAPDDGSGLEDASSVNVYVAGAESNVAAGLAHLGQQTEWFGRVGDDPFGLRIREWLTRKGIETSRVVVDPARPTGVYFKQHAPGRGDVHYYRAGSAASGLSAADYERLAIDRRRLLHVSGVTAALSPSCDELLQRMVVDRDRSGPVVSFDINYRPALWPIDVAGPRLLELARSADIVFVGRDEASTLWASHEPASIRELLPDVRDVVVKDAEHGATHFGESGATFVPALTVDVVEPVGAGDAFAAGFLAGLLRSWSPTASLRLGHVMAAFALQDVSDLPDLPDITEVLALAQVPASEWADLRIVLPDKSLTYAAPGEARNAD
jgi:2-dehydro-3-deoxygluconokinase